MSPIQTPPNPAETRNLLIAILLSMAMLYIWQVNFAAPQKQVAQAEIAAQAKIKQEQATLLKIENATEVTRDAALAASKRVGIRTGGVEGSLNLQGLRLDNITLVRHRVDIAKDSGEVVLLSPAQTSGRYFMELGWLPAGGQNDLQLPKADTLWQADKTELTPASPVVLSWTSAQNVTFRVHLAVDNDYLFTVKQEVINQSGKEISVLPYGLINRNVPESDRFSSVLHHGPIGIVDGKLEEANYEALKKDGNKHFENANGWVGVADKYWLAAFIPSDRQFKTNYQYIDGAKPRSQVDYLAAVQQVPAGASVAYSSHMFAGAKELGLLEKYGKTLNLPLFDRALDFGALYFLTKPIFLALDMFYHLLGNFGLAILLFVVLLKIVLFPLSNKSYRSMAKMQLLQPQLDRLRKQYEDDKIKMQQEVMALWQREKVNPVSGCVPMLVQIPIFFALYKVLLVTIEMRHAPFYGWIHDLSAPDPLNIFTLFGLVEWNPPAILHLGIWPIIMAFTMYVQQKMNPKPTDPVQAKVMGMLPVIFLVLFSSFPAGLLIYWAWNNVLGIIQQWVIKRRYGHLKPVAANSNLKTAKS